MLDAGYRTRPNFTSWSTKVRTSSIQHRAAPQISRFYPLRRVGVALTLVAAIPVVGAVQEIEPRTYANTPVGMNFTALAYSYSSGNVSMDPSLPIENLDARLDHVVAHQFTWN